MNARGGAAGNLLLNSQMRTPLAVVALLLPAMGLSAATQRQRHPYRQQWKQQTYGKRPVAGIAGRAGIGQITHHSARWGGGAAGLGKRVGSGLATNAVKTTVEHAVAAPLHENLHYRRSTKKGVAPRLKDALVSTVVTRNTRNGRKRPAAGRLSGHAAAGALSAAIVPAASGASTAGIGLAADAGANVVREFAPRRHKRSRRRR